MDIYIYRDIYVYRYMIYICDIYIYRERVYGMKV